MTDHSIVETPPKKTRLPSLRIGCADWRPTVPLMQSCDPLIQVTRSELLDRVVRHGKDAATANALTGMWPPLSDAEVEGRAQQIKEWRSRLAQLLADPGIQQRTPEWYAARMSLITASDVAQALASAKFGNQRQFFQKKCGLPEEQSPFDADLPPLRWGVKYEPVAQAVYCASHGGVTVHEFGLLRHPTLSHLGASPDGITDMGIMLEIKCPWRRRIVEGEVPLQYYHQIQAQLEVCGLGECDYFECEFEESDAPDPDYEFGDAHGMPYERGVLIEHLDETTGQRKYTYPTPAAGLSIPELQSWLQGQIASGPANARPRWWVLRKHACVRVPYNNQFVSDMLPRLSEVWQRVQEYRVDRARYIAEVGLPQPPQRKACLGHSSPDDAPALTTFAFVD